MHRGPQGAQVAILARSAASATGAVFVASARAVKPSTDKHS